MLWLKCHDQGTDIIKELRSRSRYNCLACFTTKFKSTEWGLLLWSCCSPKAPSRLSHWIHKWEGLSTCLQNWVLVWAQSHLQNPITSQLWRSFKYCGKFIWFRLHSLVPGIKTQVAREMQCQILPDYGQMDLEIYQRFRVYSLPPQHKPGSYCYCVTESIYGSEI